MGDFIDPEIDCGPEIYLTHYEKKCIEEWEREALEDRIQTELEKAPQRLWPLFQNSASSISHLYREGVQPTVISLWVPFQAAASSATNLYREGVEASRKCFELGLQLGSSRRTKEILSWAKKKRRHIQRDELMALLCGKPAPSKPHRQFASSRHKIDASARLPISADQRETMDLQLFSDALGLQNQGNSRRSPSRSFYEDFHFIDASSRKRINVDRLDSPSNKRPRICGMETDDF